MKSHCLLIMVVGAIVWLNAAVAPAAPLPAGWTVLDSMKLSQEVFNTSPTFDPKRSIWRSEWIEIAAPMPTNANPIQGWRWTVEVPNEVQDAALCLDRQPGYRLFINGELAGEWTALSSSYVLKQHNDLGRYFRKGKNVVALESRTVMRWGPNPKLLLEGIIRCQNGACIRILTDKTWKVMYLPPTGWEQPDFDDSKWVGVKLRGKPAAGFGEAGTAYYLSPPYYGPIDLSPPVNGKYYFYDARRPVSLPVTILPNAASNAYEVAWRAADANTEQVVQQGTLAQDCRPDKRFKSKLKIEGLKPGVYDVFVEVVDGGKVADSRVEEIAVIGKIEQREVAGTNLTDGLDLELTDTIDCADTNSPYRIVSQNWHGSNIPSRIVESKAGRYREAGPSIYDWFGFGVKLEHVGEPHLVEVEIPDDQSRIMSVKVVECAGIPNLCNDGTGRRGWGLTGPGMYTGFDRPLSQTMKKLQFVFLPKVPVTAFILASQQSTVAAGRMRIYRIKNGLPAARVAAPDYRLTGQHLERSSPMAFTFFTGPDQFKFVLNFWQAPHRGYYKNWYNSFDNMIRYMRFVGENMIVAGIYMYYPSNEFTAFWENKDSANFYELLGRMLEANGMQAFLGVEYGSDEKNRARSVSKTGKADYYNWDDTTDCTVPAVRQGMLDTVKQMADQYAATPGIGGFAFQVGYALNPMISYHVNVTSDPLDWGYGDVPIAQFAKESGLRIPDDGRQTTDTGGKEPMATNRFAIRYEWLMGNPERRAQWIDWRNRKVYELNRDIAAVVKRANPDWKSHLYWNASVGMGGVLATHPREPMLDMMRRESYDPRPYANDKTIVFGPQWVRAIRHYSAANRMWSEDPEVIRLSDERAAYVYDGFYEATFHARDFPTGGGLVCDQVHPAEREFLYAFNDVLRHATPKVMAQTWIDGQMFCGNEQERREFNRAFRVLPPGPYTTLADNGLDRNLVVRQGPKGKKETPFYVLNPSTWPVEAVLSVRLGKGGRVKDLVTGTELTTEDGGRTPDARRQPAHRSPRGEGGTTDDREIENRKSKIENNEFRLLLNSYEIRSLALAGKGEITGADVKVAPGSAAEVKRVALAKIRLYENVARIGTNQIEKAVMQLGVRRTLEQALADTQAILAAGKAQDYLTIVNLTQPAAAGLLEQYLAATIIYLDNFSGLKESFRVDCGAALEWQDSSGKVWLADRDWLAGAGDWGYVGGLVADRGEVKVDGALPELQKLYATERFGMIQYNFRLKKGTYKVRLHFMEGWCTAAGQRLFEVTLNGKKVLENFDVFKEAGGKNRALVKEFTVEAPQELLEIGFVAIGKDVPKVDGIEIDKATEK